MSSVTQFGGPFTPLPKGIWREVKGESALKVLLTLAEEMNYRSQMVEMSVRDLENVTGFKRSAIHAALQQLQDLGIIEKVSAYNRYGNQRPNVYRVCFSQAPSVERTITPLEWEDPPVEETHCPAEWTQPPTDRTEAPAQCTPYTELFQSSSRVLPEASRELLPHLAVRGGLEDDWSGPVIGQDPDMPKPETGKKSKARYADTPTGMVNFFKDHVLPKDMRFNATVNHRGHMALMSAFKEMLRPESGDPVPPEVIRTSILMCNDDLQKVTLQRTAWEFYLGSRDRLIARAELLVGAKPSATVAFDIEARMRELQQQARGGRE